MGFTFERDVYACGSSIDHLFQIFGKLNICDLTPTGLHIHFLPWVRSANFVCPCMDADFGLFARLSLVMWS